MISGIKRGIEQVKQITFFAIILETFNHWQRDKASSLAGALAFFTILSLAPLLLIMVSLLGLVADQNTIEHEVYADLYSVSMSDNGNALAHTFISSMSPLHRSVCTADRRPIQRVAPYVFIVPPGIVISAASTPSV